MQTTLTRLSQHESCIVSLIDVSDGSGPATQYGAAQHALTLPCSLHVVNPKALPVSELYGVLDSDTRDWTDGLLSRIFRSVVG